MHAVERGARFGNVWIVPTASSREGWHERTPGRSHDATRRQMQMWSQPRLNPAPTAAGATSVHILQKPALGEGQAAGVPDDAVIEHPDVHQRQRLAQPAGDELVRLAGLGNARGAVVSEDHRCGIAAERLLDDFARMHASAVDGAAKQLVKSDPAVAVAPVN